MGAAPRVLGQGRETAVRPPDGSRLALLRSAAETILHSYSQVIFAHDWRLGVLLLLASFTVPSVGIVGLAGVVLATGLALALQLDRATVRSGVLGYNALLVFLSIGAFLDRSPAFWGLAAVTALLTVIIHVGLSAGLSYYLRLPPLSLPFVAVSWLVMSAVPHIRGMALRTHLPAMELSAFPGPPLLDQLLRGLGAIFFQPWWVAGALVLLALTLWSRIAVVHGLVGFAVAVLADRFLFSFPPGFVHLFMGFNFIMTAVALGGIYYVPSASSLLLAAGGSLMCGLISAGAIRALAPFGLPVLAIPFNLTVLLTLYALGQRSRETRPHKVDFVAGAPEDNLNHYRTRIQRFRNALPIRFLLPFRGTWVCTQGNDGAHTHRGAWRHGVDFEVCDRQGRRFRNEGRALRDYLCYRLPVLAPAAGTVVRIIDGLPDNAPGELDSENNWGNAIVLQHGPELYSVLAHLSPGTFKVYEGQAVVVGQELARCGASGRSPVPHLHVQLQSVPTLGAPTRAIEFHDCVLETANADGEGPRLAVGRAHLPQEGERVRNLARSAQLGRAFALTPGETLRWAVQEGAEEEEIEEIEAHIDLLGARSLVAPERGARLWFENRGDTLYIYDYRGPRRGALFALYCALARLPLDDASELGWVDHLNPRRLTGSVLAWALDSVASFIPAPRQQMCYRLHRSGDALVVEGHTGGALARWQTPLTSRAEIDAVSGLERVEVQLAGRTLTLRRLPHRATGRP